MSHKMLRPFIVKVSVLVYFPLDGVICRLLKLIYVYKMLICY